MSLLEILVNQKLQGQQAARTKQDYQPLLRQLPTTVAAALGPLLTSRDPNVQQQGMAQLAEYQRRNSPEARQDLAFGQGQIEGQRLGQQSSRLQNLLAASQERRQQQAFPGQMEGQRLQQQLTRLQIAGQEQANAAPPPAAEQATLADIYERVNGGKLPNGMRAQLRMAPDGSQFLDAQPIEGTPEYKKDVTTLRRAEDGLELIDQFMDKVAEYGTEKGGQKARELKQLRGRLIANYGSVMQQLGVLQVGDIERLSAELPDPTAFGEQFNPMAANSILAAYQQFYDQWTQEVLGAARENYWYVPPRAVTAEEQAGGN